MIRMLTTPMMPQGFFFPAGPVNALNERDS